MGSTKGLSFFRLTVSLAWPSSRVPPKMSGSTMCWWEKLPAELELLPATMCTQQTYLLTMVIGQLKPFIAELVTLNNLYLCFSEATGCPFHSLVNYIFECWHGHKRGLNSLSITHVYPTNIPLHRKSHYLHPHKLLHSYLLLSNHSLLKCA